MDECTRSTLYTYVNKHVQLYSVQVFVWWIGVCIYTDVHTEEEACFVCMHIIILCWGSLALESVLVMCAPSLRCIANALLQTSPLHGCTACPAAVIPQVTH